MANSLTFPPEKLAEMIGRDLVFVSVGQAIPALHTPAVILDNAEGIRLGLEHLHRLGHRDIAFILGPPTIHDATVRREAILQGCRDLGLRIRKGLLEEVTDFPATSASGARAVRRILARNVPFTAVFSFDDMTAYGVIQELYRQGRTVPRDVSVVGFDDIWPSKDFNPPLTTIQVPMVEMGRESARLVVALQGKKKGESPKAAKSRDAVFKPTLIVRESTAPPQRST
jgi:DNA-binding LacI/PurR family transcriptional regulator